MNIIKTEGVITKTMDYLESSKIVTCFTPDQGKISLIAKGARRSKSRIGGSLDLLQHISIVYYHKETREIQTLSQVETIRSFFLMQKNLKKLWYGMAVIELINKLEIVKEPNQWLFRQTLDTLSGLEKSNLPALLLYQFIWRWLENSGFHPKLRHCLKCGRAPAGERVKFLIARGGFVCADCREEGESGLVISPKSIKLLLFFRENKAQNLVNLEISEQLMAEICDLSWRFLNYHSDGIGNLKTLDFLKNILPQKL